MGVKGKVSDSLLLPREDMEKKEEVPQEEQGSEEWKVDGVLGPIDLPYAAQPRMFLADQMAPQEMSCLDLSNLNIPSPTLEHLTNSKNNNTLGGSHEMEKTIFSNIPFVDLGSTTPPTSERGGHVNNNLFIFIPTPYLASSNEINVSALGNSSLNFGPFPVSNMARLHTPRPDFSPATFHYLSRPSGSSKFLYNSIIGDFGLPPKEEKRIFKCNMCSLDFKSAQAFGGHMSSHNKVKRGKMPMMSEEEESGPSKRQRRCTLVAATTNGSSDMGLKYQSSSWKDVIILDEDSHKLKEKGAPSATNKGKSPIPFTMNGKKKSSRENDARKKVKGYESDDSVTSSFYDSY